MFSSLSFTLKLKQLKFIVTPIVFTACLLKYAQGPSIV
jgi:hypothetical protein